MVIPRKDFELRYDGDPNGNVRGKFGDTCTDSSTGNIWKKTTAEDVMTGWVKTLDADDARATRVVNAQTASYILALTDAGKLVEISNGSANTLTIPPFTDVAFPVGTEIDFVQTGAGQTTVTAGAGVTITKAAATAKLLARYGRVTLQKRATDTWNVTGDLAAS